MPHNIHILQAEVKELNSKADDLLPADVVGTMIYNIKENDFSIKKGPIFANFVLADEINRAPAKVQSALLEAMQEKQVTIGDKTFKLQAPFLVMATQNPVLHPLLTKSGKSLTRGYPINPQGKKNLVVFPTLTVLFGVIHGLGFGRYFMIKLKALKSN